MLQALVVLAVLIAGAYVLYRRNAKVHAAVVKAESAVAADVAKAEAKLNK